MEQVPQEDLIEMMNTISRSNLRIRRNINIPKIFGGGGDEAIAAAGAGGGSDAGQE